MPQCPTGVAAITGNFIVLKIFSSYPALRTPANMLVLNLAFSDFCLMIALIPECCYSFFCGGHWQFGEAGCQIHAFLGNPEIAQRSQDSNIIDFFFMYCRIGVRLQSDFHADLHLV